MTGKSVAGLIAGVLAMAGTHGVEARPTRSFDGAWHLIFETRAGACDQTYSFDVNIANGRISHPNLVRFHGRVSPSGAVRASVTVPDKHASGSGRLERRRGAGSWSGYSGADRCRGSWTARKT